MPAATFSNALIGWQGDPHQSPFHLASYAVMGLGFIELSTAWGVLWNAQGEHRLARSEEREIRAVFGDDAYAGRTPRFVPRVALKRAPPAR